MVRIGILASGKGSNLPALVKATRQGNLDGDISLVICDHPNIEAAQLAKSYGIETIELAADSMPTQSDFDIKAASEFWSRGIQLIMLCGYLRMVSEALLTTYANRILNIHPSLLPAFGGKGMFGNKVLEATLERGVKITGCTVHLVNEGLDQGPIIEQETIRVDAQETKDSLRQRLTELENMVYPYAANKLVQVLSPLDTSKTPEILASAQPVASAQPKATVKDLDNKEAGKHVEISLQAEDHNCYGLCDVGKSRAENADTIAITKDARLMMVADGVGSAEYGLQTSRRIVNYMRKAWEADGDHHDDYGTSLGSWLRSQVIEGNKYIRRWGIKVNSDIGSTLVAGLWDPHNSDLYISHTGDSRAYLWRSNTLYRLTQDHAMDFDTETGAGGAIYYFIGGDSSLFGIDLFQLKVFPGDKVVLCSDGLLYIGESQLAELLRARTALPELAQSMLHRVYDVGAPDNIGICLFEATQS